MALAQSRITAQGQISIPSEVRRKLGIGPGSVIEWAEDGKNVIVRRAIRHTPSDLHRVLFPDGPPPVRTVEQMDEGIRQHLRKKHARR